MATPIATPAPADDAPVAAGGVREVARLAWPIVLTQMSQTVMHVVDSIFVGRLGAAELGALGFAGIWLWTVFSVFSGTATGVQTFVSQAWGAGDERACGRFAWQGLYALVPAAVLAVLGFVLVAEAPLGAARRDARGARARPRLRAHAAAGLRGPRDLDGARLLLPRHRRHAHAARRDDRREPRERAARLRSRARPARAAAPGASPAPASRRRSRSGWARRCSPAASRAARWRAATGRGRWRRISPRSGASCAPAPRSAASGCST